MCNSIISFHNVTGRFERFLLPSVCQNNSFVTEAIKLNHRGISIKISVFCWPYKHTTHVEPKVKKAPNQNLDLRASLEWSFGSGKCGLDALFSLFCVSQLLLFLLTTRVFPPSLLIKPISIWFFVCVSLRLTFLPFSLFSQSEAAASFSRNSLCNELAKIL